jgi:prepilin-type N-terminal cleavage/methylation domain-containing protein
MRGFTLLELMVASGVAGVLFALAGVQMRSMILGYRVSSAARELVMRMGQARSIAARTNQPIQLTFMYTGGDCIARFEMQSLGGVLYQNLCFAKEYPGVNLSPGSVTADVSCTGESDPLPNCSLCSGTDILTVYPSGEVETSGMSAAGDSIVLSVMGETTPARTVAVGIRNLNGRTRIYRPNDAGNGWYCP